MESVRPSVSNSILKRLEGVAQEDTIRMAGQVSEMVASPGWALIQEFLSEMIGALDVKAEQGLHEHVEYASMLSERRSLKTPQAIADAVIEAGIRAEKGLIEMASQMEAGGDTR